MRSLHLATVGIGVALLTGCGGGDSKTPAAGSSTPPNTSSPSPTTGLSPSAQNTADVLIQCKAVAKPLLSVGVTLGRIQDNIILPGDGVVEIAKEQSEIDAAASGIGSPGPAAKGHALADAVGKMRVSIASTGTVTHDVNAAFTAAGKAFVAACQQAASN